MKLTIMQTTEGYLIHGKEGKLGTLKLHPVLKEWTLCPES